VCWHYQAGLKLVALTDVSFVIPAYNEGEVITFSLERLVRVLSKSNLRYELIVVDDGSTDDTRDKLAKFSKKHKLTIVGCNENLGKGHALKMGLVRSEAAKVVFLDADLDIQLDNLSDYLSALDRVDVAIASKRHPESHVTAPFLRRFFSYWFNVLVRLLTGLRFSDTQTGLKAVKKQTVSPFFSKLEINRYGFDVELLIAANLRGLRIAELPVGTNTETLTSLNEMWTSLLDLLRITYKLRISKYYDQFAGLNGQRCVASASEDE
jgi:dolichyl-phosphate beta-glucosyltransferase